MAKKGQSNAVTVTGEQQVTNYRQADAQPAMVVKRRANGTLMPGYSAALGSDAARARRHLNFSTVMAIQEAFNEGGAAAIRKVMLTQPAIFLKMLVLLVPRELEVTHSAGVKGMSDEDIERTIQAIERYLGDKAKTIEGAVAQDAGDATPRDAEGVSATKD